MAGRLKTEMAVRLRVALVTLGMLLLGPAAGAGEAGFVTGMEDVPLMTGLREDPDAGLVFDKPAGRIVEAAASGALNPEQIAAFYRDTLPQLGWETVGDGPARDTPTLRFRRESEILTITLEPGKERTVVHFSLAPKAALQ